jgi:hypothetical protein
VPVSATDDGCATTVTVRNGPGQSQPTGLGGGAGLRGSGRLRLRERRLGDGLSDGLSHAARGV